MASFALHVPPQGHPEPACGSLSNPSNRSTAVRLVAGGADLGLPAGSLAPSGPASARPATTQALFLETVAARPAFAQGYGVAGVPRRQGRPQRGRLQRLIPFVFFPEKIGSSGFSARLSRFRVSARSAISWYVRGVNSSVANRILTQSRRAAAEGWPQQAQDAQERFLFFTLRACREDSLRLCPAFA